MSFKTITFAVKIIKRGFTNSTGWKDGIMNKSKNLFDPLISTPNIGTNASTISEIKNKKNNTLTKLSFSWREIINIKNKDRKTNIKCLIKKK